MKKKYFTEEERKAAKAEWNRKYEETHKAARAERNRKYRETPMGRALKLLGNYRRMDIKNGFGDVIDFDAKWIVNNIFTHKCAYCEESDWHKLGCNRIENNLPHIKSNIEPCCLKHNLEHEAKEQRIPIAQFDKMTGELVAVWPSLIEAVRQLGYDQGNINKCCNGKLKSAYGFVWRKLSNEEYERLMACLG